MGAMARVLIIFGIVLVIAGLAMWGVHKTPFWGKLPGDLVIRKEHFTLYVPLTSSIIISIIISLVLSLIGKLR